MKKIRIEDVDFNLEYEGYIWYLNDDKPIMNPDLSKNSFTELPFIIEGNLYCKNKKISISIKNIDGVYRIYQADLNNLPSDQQTIQEFIAHDLKGIAKLTMIQYWEERKSDDLLAGMATLIPTWQAFAGFIKN